MNTSFNLRLPALAAALAAVSWSSGAFAQVTGVCQVALDYAPLAPAAPVPTLDVVGLGLLAAALGALGWKRARREGGKALFMLAMAGAAALSVNGGEGLIREVRAAAGPYVLGQSAGGTLSESFSYTSEFTLQTVTNTSGVPLRITRNGNPDDTGSCTVGKVLYPRQSCTTAPVCMPPDDDDGDVPGG